MSNVVVLKDSLRELELIESTLKKLPVDRKVLREVDGRLISHTVGETLPAIDRRLALVRDGILQAEEQARSGPQKPRTI